MESLIILVWLCLATAFLFWWSRIRGEQKRITEICEQNEVNKCLKKFV